MTDIRYALRSLIKHPGFTAVAVLTLALGIGANTAIFSVVNGVLLRPLPYGAPDRIVRILGYRVDQELGFGTVSYTNLADIREQSRSFDAFAAYDEWGPILATGGDPAWLLGASVNAGFFDVLGVRPTVGRFFLPEEDPPGAAQSVVLGYQLWAERFGSDPSIVGRTLTLSGNPYTVVGVAPRRLEDPQLTGLGSAREIWRSSPAYFGQDCRSCRAFTAIARLKPGVSQARAEAEVRAIAARLAEQYPESNAGRTATLRALQDLIVGPVRPAMVVLASAVGVVLLIACVNVANLLLARAAARHHELSIRTALGASRRRLVRQLLTESLTLAILSGAAGLILALLVTDGLVALAAGSLPRAEGVEIDLGVLAFTAGVSALAGILFGLIPAFESTRPDVQASLREGGRGAGGRPGSRSARGTLVGVQVALSMVLLAGAGLLVRSLWNLSRVDPGVRPDNVLTFDVAAVTMAYPGDYGITRFYDALLPAFERLPGVIGVGSANILPLGGEFNGMGFALSDRPAPGPSEDWSAETRAVTPGFFEVIGIGLVRGRGIAAQDRRETLRVAVINQAMARQYWPGGDPIGTRLLMLDEEFEIVGIAADVHEFTLDRQPEPAIYLPHAQIRAEFMRRGQAVVIRTEGNPADLTAAVRGAVRAVAPGVPVENVRTMKTVVRATMAAPRLRTVLLTVFAGLALALALIGTYGVVAYAVAQRTREMGIRLALGAHPVAVAGLVVRQGMRPVLRGGVVGLMGALIAGQMLSRFLFGVAPIDPVTLAAVALVLALATLAACYLPARRAARIDPMEALRHE